MTEPKQREPQIAASLVNGVRRTLIEDGRWARIESDVLASSPTLASWLSAAESAEWVSLEGYLGFLEALQDLLGEDALASLGATRLRDDIDVGRLSPMLRAWMREFKKDASEFLRVGPYAWQASTRNAGRMELVDASAPGHMRLRVVDAPQVVLENRAWHAFLEGFGAELVRQSGRQGSFSIAPDGDALSFEARWSEDGVSDDDGAPEDG